MSQVKQLTLEGYLEILTDQGESRCTWKKATSSHLKQHYFVPEKCLNT